MTPKAKPARREYAPGQWTNLAEEANEGGDGTVEPVVNVYTKLKDQKQCSACALWGRRRFFGDDEWREKSPRCWKCVKAKRAAKDAALYSRAPDIIARNGGVRGRLSWGSESSGLTGSAKTRDVASAQARLKALGVRVGDDDDDASPPIRVPGLRPGSISSPSSRSTTPGAKRTYDPNAPIPEVYRSTLYPGLGYRPASRSSPSPKPSPLYRSPAASANLPSPFADRADARNSERRVTGGGGGGGGFRAPSPSSTLGAYRRDSFDPSSPSARSSFGPLDRGGAPLGTPGKGLVAAPRDDSNSNSDARRSNPNPNPNPNRRGGGSSPSSRSATESSTFGVPRIFDRFGEKVPSPDGVGAPGARVGTRRCARCGLTGKPTRFSEEEWHAPNVERRCLTCAGESPTTTLARGTRSGAPDYSPSRASEFARADPAAAAADDDDTDERLGYREYAYGDGDDDDAGDEFRFDRPRPRRRPSATSTTYSVKSQRAEFASDGFGNGPSSPPSPGAGLWYGASSGNPKRAYRALIDACRLREEDAFLYLRESVGRYAAAVAGNARDRSSAAREHLREFARRADDIGATPEWWTPLHAEMMLQRATDPDDELFVRPVDPTSRATDVATEITRRWGLAGTESLRDLHFAVFPETWEDWGGRRATGEGLDADVPSRHREGDAYDYRVDLSPADRPPRRRTDEREVHRRGRDDFLGGFVATDRDDPEPASRLEPSSSFNPRADSGSGSPRSIGSGSRSPTRSRAPPRASSAARRAAIRAAARTPPPASASRPRPLASPRDPDAGMPVRGDARDDLDFDVDDVGEGRIFSAEDLDPSERRAVDVDARADRAARDARAKLLDAGVADDVACVVSCKSRWGRAGLDLDDWNEADPFTRRVLDALRARGLGCAGARAAGFDDLRLSPASSRRPKAVVLVGVGGAGGDVADMLTNRRWIEELVRYVEDGGVFIAHGEGDEIAEAFSWFGAPWTFGGDYLRASYDFNRECDAVAEWDEWSGAWRDWSSGAAGRYDVKANCLMGVAKRHRAFRPVAAFEDDAETTADAVARGRSGATRAGAGSTASGSGSGSGAAEFDLAARLRATGLDPEGTLEACPFAVAQFGHGHVAFVGDVEGTDATVDLIARVATTPRKPTPRYPDDEDEDEDEGEDEGFGGVGGGR